MKLKVHILGILTLLNGICVAAPEKPNILFIAIDDLRPELGCYGVGAIHSPNIDRLADSGVRFDRAYCQLAVCNPSRVSLLTGLRPDSAKVWTLDVRFRDTVPDVVTLPQHFKRNGYYAVSYGKIFHNPWPDNASWNEPHQWPKKAELWSDKAKQRLTDYLKKMRAAGKSAAAIKRMRGPATEIVDIPDSKHIDGAIADQTLVAMRRLAKKDAPFFLAAGFIRPHLPFVVPRKYWDLYDRDKIKLTENEFLPKGSPKFAMNTMYELRDYMDYAKTADPRKGSLTEAQQRELKHGYYAAVSFIDAQVGRLLDELDRLDLADNTIVVLWGDHGWKLGEHNSWCKQTNYEIDTRAPLIIRDPHAQGNGRASRSLVEFVDIYPTLCDLTGVPAAKHLEGMSLKPILNDPGKSIKDAAFSQFRRKTGKQDLMGYTMRTDQYRYVEWIDRRTHKAIDFELYDHKTDPGENVNLAKQSEQNDRLKKLSAQLWKALPTPPPFTADPPKKDPCPTIRFQNDRKESLIVYWLPKGGKPKRVGEIAPGKSILQNTSKDHQFLIEGTKSTLRKTFTVKKQTQTVVLAVGKSRPKPKPITQPNILFLMADDWSWPHAGALGDPVVKTPTFDRLVREGVLFNHAFVSAPSCTPSRHSISSGQYHWRLKDGVNLGGSIPKNTPVYPDLLAKAGYLTGFSRKGTAPSQHTYRKNDPFGPRFKNFETFYAKRKTGQAFCFWYGAGEPHRPYDWQASKRENMKLDAIKVPACLPDNETVRTDLGDYYVKVQQFDRDAARMIALLEKNGELANTIVVMSGDNGMPFPRCKATLYDLGTRVPLVILWGDKMKGGHTIDDFVSLTDLAPTFLEAAGLPIPEEMTGRSLMKQLESEKNGQIESNRDHVITGMERHVYSNPSRAIRTKEFLYIRNFSPSDWPTGRIEGKQPHYDFVKTPWPTTRGAFSYNVDPGPAKQWMRENAESGQYAPLFQHAFGRRPREELYHLKNDPAQLNNVIDKPSYTETRKQLSEQLSKKLHDSGDPHFASTNHSTFTVNGWTINLNNQLLRDDPGPTKQMLDILDKQLERVVKVIPPKALKHLLTVPIWINPPYEGKPPGAAYHPNINWLRENDRDPSMAKAIEITNVLIFPFENKRMPYLMLHELAHAYHDQVLAFDQPEIRAAFEQAMDSKGYEKVKRFTGKKIVTDKAYAMSNHKEYFAEATEAYFGKNDFFPFTQKELKAHDPKMYDLLAKVWGVKNTESAKLSPVIPLSKLKWQAASKTKHICPPSTNGGAKTTVVFRNNRTTPATVFWIDGKGKRAQQFTISPGNQERRLTYAGHSWLITDNKGADLGHFISTETPSWADIPAILIPSNHGKEKNAALYPITSPPAEFDLDPFYRKYLNLDGFPILSSDQVSDYAIREAAYLIRMMLANRPDVLKALAASGSRLTVMAHDEYTTDVPEHSHMGKKSKTQSSDWWDRRARGLGGSETDPVASCAEENLLCFPGDPYSKENILIHEFAHMMHLRGLKRIDPTFDVRLEKAWEKAMEAGLWKDKYPSTNSREYFAEGVQSWFNNNRENDYEHNHVNTRKELIEYDPDLAALLKEVFGDTKLVYTKPPERKLQAHLENYDYSKSPTFKWPERLEKINNIKTR